MMRSGMKWFDGRDGWMSPGRRCTAFIIVDAIAFPLTATILTVATIIVKTTTS